MRSDAGGVKGMAAWSMTGWIVTCRMQKRYKLTIRRDFAMMGNYEFLTICLVASA